MSRVKCSVSSVYQWLVAGWLVGISLDMTENMILMTRFVSTVVSRKSSEAAKGGEKNGEVKEEE